MISQKSKVKSQNLRPATCDLRPSTCDLRPATCDWAKRGAFTMIEVVVTVVLLALVSGITIHYLVSASQLYTLLLAQKQSDSEVVDAVNRMRREARLHVQTITANSNEWTFSNTYAATTVFLRSGTDLNLNGNRLATGINRFTLSYYDDTNSRLVSLPLSPTNRARIRRVALDIKATNNLRASELKVNFFLREDLLK